MGMLTQSGYIFRAVTGGLTGTECRSAYIDGIGSCLNREPETKGMA